jgi:hypothetical protein
MLGVVPACLIGCGCLTFTFLMREPPAAPFVAAPLVATAPKPWGNPPGARPAGATLTQREKRNLRWTMLFNTNNGPDYLSQLRGLGAILAIPVKETGGDREYKIVEDLSKRPAELLDRDLSTIQHIYWVDDHSQTVRDIMAALGLRLRPSHFVAFMPESLENQLFELEKAAAKGRPEEEINETKFRVKKVGDHYEPELSSITFKH